VNSIRRTSQKIASDKISSKKIGGNDKPNTTMTGNRLMLTLVFLRLQVINRSYATAGKGKESQARVT